MSIKGIHGLSDEDLKKEIDSGARFVYFEYCISIIILSFRRPSTVFFVRSNEKKILRGLMYSLISLLLGWWGIPWGPIYTISSFITNIQGGKNVTNEIMYSYIQKQNKKFR